MATDLQDKQGVDDDAGQNPVQQHYNDQFNQLTSPGHYAQNAEEPDYAGQTRDAEEGAAQAGSADAGVAAEAGLVAGATAGAAENQIPFNADDTGRKGSGLRNVFWGTSLRRRSTIGGSIAGVSIGGLMFAAVIGSGPFEFIHLAQLLTRFHFSNIQDASNDRSSKLFRFVEYARGKPERTRMNMLGNKYANAIEVKMNVSGIQSAYTDKFGNYDGYVIDPEKLANSELSKFQGSPDEIKTYFKNTYGVELQDGTGPRTGKLVIGASDLGYFNKQRDLMAAMMKESGFSDKAAALGARIMGRRAGINWSPLTKLNTKLQNAVEGWWNNRNKQIESGSEPSISTQVDPNAEKNAPPGQQADTANSENSAKDTLKVAQSGDVSATNANIHSKIAARGTAGGAALIGVACLAYGIAENVDNIKQTEVVLPLMRMGMEAIIVGNQVMSGQNVDVTELGKLANQITGWDNAKSMQAGLNEPQTGIEATDTIKSLGAIPPLSFLNAGAWKGVLGGLCSAPVQIGITVLSFLGGPVTAAVQFLGGAAAAPLINGMEHDLGSWLVGKAVDPATIAHEDYGNAVNYGTRYAADQQAIAGGGVAMTPAQSAQLKATETLASNQEFDSQSLAYRVFNPYDNRTLVSHVMDSFSPSVTQNMASMVSGFTHIGSSIFSSFGSIFSGVTHADSGATYDYGFPEYGFSESDLNNPLVENPYENADAAATLLDNNNQNGEPDYITLANQCFGVNLVKVADTDPNGNPVQVWDVSTGTTTPKLSDIQQHDCVRQGDNNWLRIRFFIFDTENMESIGCYENDAQSCSEINMSNGPSVSYGVPGTATQSIASRPSNHTQTQSNIAFSEHLRAFIKPGFTQAVA